MNQLTSASPGESSAPICVLGMPRSGTTWLGKILDSHPETLYRHEPDSGAALGDVPLTASAEPDSAASRIMEQFLTDLPRQHSVKVCGKLPLFAKRYLPGWRGHLHRGSVYLAKAASKWVTMPILEPVDAGRAEPRPVWKSIESTGRAGLIAATNPDARVILLVRHPCGQIDSTLRGESAHHFADECASAEDWGIFERLLDTPQAARRGLSLELLRESSPVERLAWRWLLFNEKAMDELRDRDNGFVVRYESLCERPLEVARELFAFAGLDWPPEVEAFIEASAGRDDGRYYSVYRDPLTAAEGWRRRLDSETVKRIHAVVADSSPGRLFETSFAETLSIG